MKKKDNYASQNNFWISYADLMAGLLFVFILLIGAIIVKYSFLEKKSQSLQDNLETESSALISAKKMLEQKEKKILYTLEELKEVYASLKIKNKALEEANTTITLNKTALVKQEKELVQSAKDKEELHLYINLKKKELLEKKEELKINKDSLKNKESQLSKIKILFINKNKELEDSLSHNLKNKADLKNIAKKNELLLQSLDTAYIQIDENNMDLKKHLQTILEKKILLEEFKISKAALDSELLLLQTRIIESEKNFNSIAQDLKVTKEKIKNFTGMKVKVIQQLKNSLGKDISIDAKSGKLVFSSNILFEQGASTLKPEAKNSLKKAVNNYFNAILENDEINKHIDKIVIEGHTNSIGSFLYNLNLSQKRAFAVMDFIFAQNFNKKEKLKHLLISSGRSFLDPIYKNGKEDEDASRRIEIKFSLKNEEAIKEIESLLIKDK